MIYVVVQNTGNMYSIGGFILCNLWIYKRMKYRIIVIHMSYIKLVERSVLVKTSNNYFYMESMASAWSVPEGTIEFQILVNKYRLSYAKYPKIWVSSYSPAPPYMCARWAHIHIFERGLNWSRASGSILFCSSMAAVLFLTLSRRSHTIMLIIF